ncbi:semaphorin-5A [Aplysia californica]|uniref:Semaphorin-5A n=1 Tax=Aplysia californica TaxID=6500 RepID=A0ABM1VVF2_APLCA|nr:semaphorin-5A [Aplysia californica]
MEKIATVLVLVAIATSVIQQISGQGWTYQPIGEGWQADASVTQKEEDIRDFRFISYESMIASGARFTDQRLVSFVQFAVDEDRYQLLVGGRDSLFRLDLKDLSLLEQADWKSDDRTHNICIKKGQTAESCHNFVRVLLMVDKEEKVFACGTNSFNPQCTWRNVSHLSSSEKTEDGRGICPYSPNYNATALITSRGDLYAATVVDYSARDPAISRQLGNSPRLRTMKQHTNWLNEPNFVSAYEIGNFVYFFFRETAVEFINCGKRVYSRVARVCKNDKGGEFSLKHIWTSYHKARLNCSLPGNYPFYFDELQSTFYSPDENLVYAVFSTPPNSIPGSAVCVYNMSAFQAAFDGPFKHQEDPSAAWLPNENKLTHSKCSLESSSSKRSSEQSSDLWWMNAKRYQLMDKAVASRETGPLIMRENERWTHIVVDHVLTKANLYDVLFLATEDGKVRKMLRLPGTNKTCLIEEIKIVQNGKPRPVKSMKISPYQGAIYISTDGDILKIPVERCHRFTTSTMCMNAQDPYCGWDSRRQRCTAAPGGNPHAAEWEQDFRQCPVLDYPVHGGWSEWSDWDVCRQVGLDRMVDQCLCRSRSCDSPRPANNGMGCLGPSMEVSNCTVHGNWTEWSAWSACSQTCGFATRMRSRQCGSPPPKFGGRQCQGQATEEEYCRDNPECPCEYRRVMVDCLCV